MIKRFYIETYGCQMNEYDSQILAGILTGQDYAVSGDPDHADIILLNTCSVREHAEQKDTFPAGGTERTEKNPPENRSCRMHGAKFETGYL
ncbi:MAG: hypothetical protein U5N56_00315 [Candidatus Marinimicrobia bacterium]|nr:hypothetical protein [Candidatus Neomarinimicrobiota bacterium]